MELDFDTDQEDLRDSARAFLAAECPIALVRDVVEARVAHSPVDAGALHAHMVELGWPALAVPADAGGLGLGAIEIALLAEELGRALAPGPLFATITQYVPVVRALASPEQAVALLTPVAHGEVSGTVAVAEGTGATDPAATTVVASPRGDGWALHGAKHTVFEPAAGGTAVVVARVEGTEADDGVGAFVVPLAECGVEPVDVVDPSRLLATVTLDGVAVDAAQALGTPGPATAAALRRALDTATMALALDAVGAAQQLFDVSLDYVKQREQFGVPVGSFQAIKHKFADLLVLLERARALGYYAALTIAEDDAEQSVATAMAKAAAGDVATQMAKEGIQVHGGIGYTWEADVHLYVRRLQTDAVLFGTPEQHRRQVAELIGV
jgi:alkylation response protein AidB-like acyl-CoA dehydrogenase